MKNVIMCYNKDNRGSYTYIVFLILNFSSLTVVIGTCKKLKLKQSDDS